MDRFYRDNKEIKRSDIEKIFNKINNKLVKFILDGILIKNKNFVIIDKSFNPNLNIVAEYSGLTQRKDLYNINVITVKQRNNFISNNSNDLVIETY